MFNNSTRTGSNGQQYYYNRGGEIVPFRRTDAIRTLDGWGLELTYGPWRVFVDEAALLNCVRDEANERWHALDPRKRGPPPIGVVPSEPAGTAPSAVVAPRKASNLEFSREQGRGARSEVINPFLETPHIDHHHGEIQGWKAAWTARSPSGDVLGAIVVGRPTSRILDDGTRLEVTRLATHPIAPRHANSWMLRRATRWVERQGYDELISYAGAAENTGTCYDGAGFDQECLSCRRRLDGHHETCPECGDETYIVEEADSWNSAED